MRRIASAAALCLLLAVTLTACTTEDRAMIADQIAANEAKIEEVQAGIADMDAAITDATAQIDQLPEGDPVREVLTSYRDTKVLLRTAADDTLNALLQESDHLQQVLRESKDASEAARGVVGVAAPYLPPPWNVYLTAGLGLWAAIENIFRRRTKAAARNVVRAIEETKVDGAVDFSDDSTKTVLRSRMTDEAKALVESARAAAKKP